MVEFVAPREFIRNNDWIGLYPVGINASENTTVVKSNGLWKYVRNTKTKQDTPVSPSLPDLNLLGLYAFHSVGKEEHVDGSEFVKGSVVFAGDVLPWKTGVYEARYHHDEKYHVLCLTGGFTVHVEQTLAEEQELEESEVKRYLVDLVQKAIAIDELSVVNLSEEEDLFDAILTFNGPLDKGKSSFE